MTLGQALPVKACPSTVSSLVHSGFPRLSEETPSWQRKSVAVASVRTCAALNSYRFQNPLWVPGVSPVFPGAGSLCGWAAITTLSVSDIQMNTFL